MEQNQVNTAVPLWIYLLPHNMSARFLLHVSYLYWAGFPIQPSGIKANFY